MCLVFALLLSACAPAQRASSTSDLNRIVVNGAELTYSDEGRGETIILMHGSATDYRVWDAVRRELRRNYRVVAYSRRHHSPNAWPDDGKTYTMIQHAADLVGLVRALGVDRAHIVAVSMGARVAAHVTVQSPDVVRTVTLSDGLLAATDTESGKREMEKIGPKFAAMFDHLGAGRVVEGVRAYAELSSESDWQRLHPVLQDSYLDNARTLVLASTDQTLRPPSCDALRSIRRPVLVLAGAHTPKAIEAMNEALLKCLESSAEYAKVPDAGHHWYLDNPAEGARVLQAFFRQHAEK